MTDAFFQWKAQASSHIMSPRHQPMPGCSSTQTSPAVSMQESIRSVSSPARQHLMTWKRATPNQPGFSTVSVKCAQNWRGSACDSPNSPDAIFRNIHNRLSFQAYIDKNEQKCACRTESFLHDRRIFSMESAGFQPYYVSPTSTHARLFNSCFLCLQSGISSVIS